MKTTLSIALLIGLFSSGLGSGFASAAVDTNSLEPCINGRVSALGLYPTQAEEDAAFAEARRLSGTMQSPVPDRERLEASIQRTSDWK